MLMELPREGRATVGSSSVAAKGRMGICADCGREWNLELDDAADDVNELVEL